MTMHAAERERLILEMMQVRGFISFQELDGRMDAAPATIRRDLERLARQGRIERVRGGARPIEAALNGVSAPHLAGVPFHENIALNTER